MAFAYKYVFDIRFSPDGFKVRYPNERKTLEAFCAGHKGKNGFIVIHAGEQTRSIAQNALYHGPVLDSFSEATGISDRAYLKAFTKEIFKDKHFLRHNEKGEKYYCGTSDLSVRQMQEYLTDLINYLFDHGGNFEKWQAEEWKKIRDWDEKKEVPNLEAEMAGVEV